MNMINSVLPSQDPLAPNPSVNLKSSTTVASNPPEKKDNKLPPNAKIVGNYLLGIYYKIQGKI